jgi:hypothetical protein
MNQISLKPIMRASERQLIGAIRNVRDFNIDLEQPLQMILFIGSDPALVGDYLSGCKSFSNADVLESVVKHILRLLRSRRIRIKLSSGTECHAQFKEYTWTSLLFDMIDLSNDFPSVSRRILGDVLKTASFLRRLELDNGDLVDWNDQPCPDDIKQKIYGHLNMVDRIVSTGGFSQHDLHQIRVTYLAPYYHWKNWVDFK